MDEKTKDVIKLIFIFVLMVTMGSQISKILIGNQIGMTFAAAIGGGTGGFLGYLILKYLFKLDFNVVLKNYMKKS